MMILTVISVIAVTTSITCWAALQALSGSAATRDPVTVWPPSNSGPNCAGPACSPSLVPAGPGKVTSLGGESGAGLVCCRLNSIISCMNSSPSSPAWLLTALAAVWSSWTRPSGSRTMLIPISFTSCDTTDSLAG